MLIGDETALVQRAVFFIEFTKSDGNAPPSFFICYLKGASMPLVDRSYQNFPAGIKVVGGITTGSVGNSFADLLFGSACINCPSAVADSTVVSASLAISNVSDGDELFVTPMTSVPSAMQLVSACCISGGISASWLNSASTDSSASADVPVSYLILK